MKKPFLSERHRRIIALILENKAYLIFSMLCMLVISATTVASAYLIKPALDDIFVNKDKTKLFLIPLAIVIVYFLRGLAHYGQEFFMSYMGQKIIMRLRNLLYDRIVDLPLAFYHDQKTGTLMSRITNDVNIIKSMVSNVVASGIRDLFSIVFMIAYIIWLIWWLALLALVILPLAFYPIVWFGRRVRKVTTGFQESMADMNVMLHETFSGNKIVKAFGMEAREKERFHEKADRIFRLEMRTVVAKSLSSPVMEFLGGFGIAFVIWFGGMHVIKGEYSVGTFFSFITAVIMLYDPVKKLSKLNNSLQEGLSALDRVFDIVEQESIVREAEQPVVIPRGPHHVRFESVWFGYNDQETVLADINVEARPGEVLALVGMSGGGKTSFVNLIPRFYDVSRGRIAIDGIDIRDASIASLREQIAIVTQEPILFNDTVRNNIAYGKPEAGEEEIIRAARDAFAHDFIMGFPQGYQTSIGELGSRLSGGEKQRICIARALLKDAPILILDEATSSLDTQAEMLVQKALENLMQGRTTFVIAHRLSTVAHAHRILAIKEGRIVEEGRHEDLLRAGGEYARLYQMQFAEEP